jgi:hypothetical protein
VRQDQAGHPEQAERQGLAQVELRVVRGRVAKAQVVRLGHLERQHSE